MAKSGCVGIEIGVESANPKVLLAVKKGETVSEVVKAAMNQKKKRGHDTPLYFDGIQYR
jgi:radical SAM superfamily enzyme YgiQ (UPF0313 family)